jgi:hypothetical protein
VRTVGSQQHIIRSYQAQGLFAYWAGNDNREDEIVHGPIIMLIGTGDVNCQKCPSFVNQIVGNVNSLSWGVYCYLGVRVV